MEAKHREIYKAHYGQDSIKDGNVIHHLDHDYENNNIINLAQMSSIDHDRLHQFRCWYELAIPDGAITEDAGNGAIRWLDI